MSTIQLDQPPANVNRNWHGLNFPLEDLQVTVRLLQVTTSFAGVDDDNSAPKVNGYAQLVTFREAGYDDRHTGNLRTEFSESALALGT